MTFLIELTPELERRVQEEAALRGRTPAEVVCELVAERLHPARDPSEDRNRAAREMLRRWREEDTVNPDPDPAPTIPRLSLREIKLDVD